MSILAALFARHIGVLLRKDDDRFWHKADMTRLDFNVRFRGEADIGSSIRCFRPLWSVEELDTRFIPDGRTGQKFAYVLFLG